MSGHSLARWKAEKWIGLAGPLTVFKATPYSRVQGGKQGLSSSILLMRKAKPKLRKLPESSHVNQD